MFNHRPYCRKEARCVKCGRYICKVCNGVDKNGIYGVCGVCEADLHNYKNQLLLPLRPIIKPKNITRFLKKSFMI